MEWITRVSITVFIFFSSYDSIHMGRFQADISLFSAYLDGYLSGCA